jgi:hypothetical protein
MVALRSQLAHFGGTTFGCGAIPAARDRPRIEGELRSLTQQPLVVLRKKLSDRYFAIAS